MAKKNNDASTPTDESSFFEGANWSPIEVPKAGNKVTKDYDALVNDDFEPAPKAKAHVAPKLPAEKFNDELDDDVDDLNEDDDFEPLDEDEEFEPEEEESETEEFDLGEDEEDEVPEEKPKGKKDVEERFKKYTKLLKEKDNEILERDLTQAQLQVALESQKREYEAKLRMLSTSYAESIVKGAEGEVEQVRAKLRNARDLGDTEVELEAGEELAEAKARLIKAREIASTIPTEDEQPNYQPMSREQLASRQKATVWLQKNQAQVQDALVKQAIAHIDTKLNNEGIFPTSPSYLTEVTTRVNRILERNGRKPALVNPFPNQAYSFDDSEDEVLPKKATQMVKKKNPQASVSPALTKKKSRVLASVDASEVAQAAKYGISKEQLLKQKAARLAAEGRPDDKKSSWKPIFVPSKR